MAVSSVRQTSIDSSVLRVTFVVGMKGSYSYSCVTCATIAQASGLDHDLPLPHAETNTRWECVFTVSSDDHNMPCGVTGDWDMQQLETFDN